PYRRRDVDARHRVHRSAPGFGYRELHPHRFSLVSSDRPSPRCRPDAAIYLPEDRQSREAEESGRDRVGQEAGEIALRQLQPTAESRLRHRPEDEPDDEWCRWDACLDEGITEKAEAQNRPHIEHAAGQTEGTHNAQYEDDRQQDVL